MTVEYDTEVRLPDPSPQHASNRFKRLLRRIKLALAGNDDQLVVSNQTKIAWHIYHDYHHLGIIDPDEQRTFNIVKRGSFNVRPGLEGDAVDYLVLPLDRRTHRIRIYQRHLAQEVIVYDMRAA